MWEADSVIDELCLDNATIDCAKMHCKYLTLLTNSKLQLKRLDMNFNTLKKDKWLYFTGQMTKEQISEHGWPFDPFNGATKPLKANLDYYYNADEDLMKIQAKMDFQKTIIETLVDIMDNLKWRGSAIKNIIDWKRFTSGG